MILANRATGCNPMHRNTNWMIWINLRPRVQPQVVAGVADWQYRERIMDTEPDS